MGKKYDLLAIDLDGTLLGPSGEVSEGNVRAVRSAVEAGMRVTICTGRGLHESRDALRRIAQVDPVVVAGGAIVSCPVSRRTLHRYAIRPELATRLVGCLVEHDHAALVLKDAAVAGYDYLVVSPRGEGAVSPITRWWFEALEVEVRYAVGLAEDEHPEATVRVGVCGTLGETRAVAREVKEAFAGEVTFNHFGAVVPGVEAVEDESRIVILEVFDRVVNKWTAIEHVAGEAGIDAGRIASIGNDVNDVEMIRRSGLGVAMGNAIEDVKRVAARETVCNRNDGVAWAIERILDGRW